MSYIQKSYKGAPIWVGGLIALVLLSRCAVGLGGLPDRSARMDTPEAVERALFAHPDTGGIYRAMKRAHPEEFSALTRDVAGRSKRGQSQKQIDTAISNFVAEAEARHRGEMDQAGPAALAAFRRAEIQVIEALKQADPRFCAHYAVTGQFELPEGYKGSVSAIADLHIAVWNAMGDGRAHPVGRKLVQPSEADWARIDAAMLANGTDRQTIKLFFDPKGTTELTPARQCDAALSFRRAIETLPAASVDNFYLGLLNAAPS